MYRDDSNNERIGAIIDMLKRISEDSDPVRSISHYARRMRELYGEQGLISVSLRNAPPGHYRVMRFLNQRGAGLDHLLDIEFAGPDAPYVSGGIIGNIIQSPLPVVYRDLQIDDDPILKNRLAPYRVLVAVPVFDRSQVLNWVIFMTVESDGFTSLDVETRVLQSNLMSSIGNIKRANQELIQATDWIHREVDEIALIQQGLLPGTMPHVPGLSIAASYQSFDRAGGDLYAVFPLGRTPEAAANELGPWGIFIADVSGHGVAAAVIVAMVSTLIDALAERLPEPGPLLTHLNRHVAAKAINGNFVTAFLVTFDPDSQAMTYACAGHPMPLLRETHGPVGRLPQTQGIPLGIASDSVYESVPLSLEPGQTLLLYTDGISESRSPEGKLFGEPAIGEILFAAHGGPAQIIQAVNRALEAHQQGQPQADDQAMVALSLADLRT